MLGAMRVGQGAWPSTFEDVPVDPALALHEITPSASVRAAASAPMNDVVDAAREASAVVAAPADASVDASPTKVAAASKPDASIGLGGLGLIGHISGSCGAVACGETSSGRGVEAAIGISISGSQGRDEQTIRTHIGNLRRCAAHGLQNDPSMQATLAQLLGIDDASNVTVTTQSNKGRSAEVVTCTMGVEFEKAVVRSMTVQAIQ